MSQFNRPAALAAAIVSILATAIASAAEAPTGLEEIVVTAQKRAESVQDVPISVVAVTGDALEKMNQADFLALATRTPTLQYSQAGGESQIYIRGIGSNLLSVGADPSVAIHLDGVYLGRPSMGLSQFLDVERVEVLRGPQGTLYGRNATGGSINIVSRQPTQEFEGYVGAGVGSFSRVELKGAVSGPLSDTLSFRLAARSAKDDGYTDDLDSRGSNRIDNNDLTALRGILRFEPSDAASVSLSWDYSEFDNGNTSIRPLDDKGAAQVLGAVPTGSLHQTRNDLPTFLSWDTGGPTLNAEFTLGEHLTLTSITAYKTFDLAFMFNTDGTEIDVTRTTTTMETEQLSQELRLASEGLEGWRWIVGGYYLQEDKEGALGLVRANLATPGTFNIFAENDTTAWAGFGEVSFDLTDTLSLTAGVRYSSEQKDDANRQFNVFASTTNPTAEVLQGLFGDLVYGNPASSRTDDQTWTAWTPRLGIDWKPRDGLLIYGSFTEGFKSGGFNDYQPSNPVYGPESIKSYELGLKSDWADGRVRFNAAAFHYDYEDLQVTSFFQSLTLVSNAASATVNGIDLELVARPVPELEIGASLSWLDATYDDFMAPYGRCSPLVAADPSCAGRPNGSPRLVDASGNRLNNAPETKGSLYGRYDIGLGNAGTLSLFGQLSYTDDLYFNAANAPEARVGAYTLLDARIAWTNAAGNIEVALVGKNLGDEDYYHNIVQFTSTSLPPPATSLPAAGAIVTDPFATGNALGYPAPGRSWGLDLNWRF